MSKVLSIPSTLPQELLVDRHDPVQCADNTRSKAYGSITRIIYKEEVRSYYTALDSFGQTCRVDLYPQGCESTSSAEVWAAAGRSENKSLMAQNLCSQLQEAAFHDRTVCADLSG